MVYEYLTDLGDTVMDHSRKNRENCLIVQSVHHLPRNFTGKFKIVAAKTVVAELATALGYRTSPMEIAICHSLGPAAWIICFNSTWPGSMYSRLTDLAGTTTSVWGYIVDVAICPHDGELLAGQTGFD